MNQVSPASREETLDVVVVGAGFGGLYALHRLRGMGLKVRVFEAADGVGGTWCWNRYPGARCDVESYEYQLGFDPDLVDGWTWSERYATQPEIMAYQNYVADKLDLKRDIVFETRVTSATYDEASGRWRVATNRGHAVSARFVVMATGCLSSANVPKIEGLESFQGEWHHTGNWPHEPVDFRGKRVAVIGTGSSGVQAIPVIAEEAGELVVFQRTANYSIPAHNRPLEPGEAEAMKRTFAADRAVAKFNPAGTLMPVNEVSALAVDDAERNRAFEERWDKGGFAFLGTFVDLMTDPRANKYAADFVADRIRKVVHDPKVAELLIPNDHPFGAKRLCLDTDYFETFNRPNVSLVDVRATPIQRFTPTGIETTERSYEFDIVVFATGFDAMTGSLMRIDIRGRDGLRLADKWAAGPITYLGLQTAGFPNLFFLAGPGSPSVLTNVIMSCEQHAEWIADCIADLGPDGTIEARPDAEAEWVAHVNEAAAATLFMHANSWYLGANVPGKPRVFMPYIGGLGVYRTRCSEVVAEGYRGFEIQHKAPAEVA